MSRCVFFLMRHAATLWNLDKRIQGQWDSELSPAGLAACEAMAPGLARLSLGRILASDLGRAKATAGILNRTLGLPVTLERRLREQHFGDWTGKHWRDIPAAEVAAAEAAGWQFQPPGGESRAEVHSRAGHALRDAARTNGGKRVLVVTHQGVVKAVVYHLLGRAYLPDEPPAYDRRLLQEVVCQGGVLSLGRLDIDPAAP
ncbi:histidine phosphatase family protein [Solidesulfovibrio sp.]